MMDVYTAAYCEENIYFLCEKVHPSYVVFISNESEKTAIWHQKLGNPVVWDYHVILLSAQGLVYDFDSTLPRPTNALNYITKSFQPCHVDYQPRFRIAKSAEYLRLFASDRSHMRESNAKAPDYPVIGTGMNLYQWRDMKHPIRSLDEIQFDGFGSVLTLELFLEWLAASL